MGANLRRPQGAGARRGARCALRQLACASAQAGQMVVELAAVMPVVLMVAVAVIDGLVFTAACSSFDHLAAQGVLSVAAVPAGTEFSAADAAQELQARLQESSGEQGRVRVEAQEQGSTCCFTCSLSMAPWPLARPGERLFSTIVPLQLEHSFSFAVRPYVVGRLL